jgi:hypothetical protein
LIEALKEAPDVNFQRWLPNQVDLWSMRKLDWKQDGSDLMDEAEVYYQEAINTYRWGKKTHKQNVVYAFRTEESESEVEKQPNNSSQKIERRSMHGSLYHQRIINPQRRGCILMESIRCIIGVHIIYNGQYTALVSVRGNHQG